jgi:hypothetical protein
MEVVVNYPKKREEFIRIENKEKNKQVIEQVPVVLLDVEFQLKNLVQVTFFHQVINFHQFQFAIEYQLKSFLFFVLISIYLDLQIQKTYKKNFIKLFPLISYRWTTASLYSFSTSSEKIRNKKTIEKKTNLRCHKITVLE